jgi:hypothetical protein
MAHMKTKPCGQTVAVFVPILNDRSTLGAPLQEPLNFMQL